MASGAGAGEQAGIAPDGARATAGNPLELHLKAVGVLNLVSGLFAALLATLFLTLTIAGTVATSFEQVPDWVAPLVGVLGAFFAVVAGAFAVLALLSGQRLLARRRSGRWAGIVVAAILLPMFPIGTAMGIYACVVLLHPRTDELWVDPQGAPAGAEGPQG